jgi:hypothetical protein
VFERQFRAAAERAYRQQQAASAQPAARPGGWFPNVFANFFGGGGGHGKDEMWDDDIGAFAPFSRVSWTEEHEEQLRKLKAEMEQQVGCFRSWTAADQRNPQRFYDFFGAGFSSLAPYSKRQPVPRLGGAQSPLPTVHAFYRFWRAFSHTRSFREELPGGNFGAGAMKVRERAVVAFSRLVSEFVATAASFDPRLAQADAQAAQAKAAKAQRAAAEAAAKARADEAAARAEAQKAEQEREAAAAAKKAKEAQRKAAQKARQKERQAAAAAAAASI